jgi:protein-export membrane protein SecD/preprotein translocase SecF subunit
MYPPASVVVRVEQGYEKTADTPEEAQEHEVRLGESYWVSQETLQERWLPLAMGEKTEHFELVGRDDEGRLLKKRYTVIEGRVKLGLDIAGGGELVYRIQPATGQSTIGLVDKVINTLKQRIDPHGVKEFRIQSQGANRILIQVPGASKAEIDQLKRRLTRMGKLEFRLIPSPEDPAFAEEYQRAAEGKTVQGYTRMYVSNPREGRREWYLVKTGRPEITGEYLSDVYPTQDQYGKPAVGFQFGARGGSIFAMVTEQHLNWHLGIILDGELKSAPVIRARIKGSGIIEGDFTMQEVNDMVNILRAGSLPVDIELEMESTVGPSLGSDSIRQGLRAVAIGGLLVLIFMAGYYMFCGMVADGALIFNLVLLVGALGLLGASLTLPGIAGIMLTVGMAVDANVLVYERIREEKLGGRSLLDSIRNGYDRAFITIVDANVTTLLTALILYAVGTGPVKGFAVTLSVGIILSMFTALFCTRLFFRTAQARGWVREMRMRRLFTNPSFRFTGNRRLAYVISALVIVAGLSMFFTRGETLYDIDFTGGTLADIAFEKGMTAGEVRQRLAAAGYPAAEVQAVRAAGAGQGLGRAREFSIRIKGLNPEQRREKLRADLEAALKDSGAWTDGGVKVLSEEARVDVTLASPMDERAVGDILYAKGAGYSADTLSALMPREPLPAEGYSFIATGRRPEDDPVYLNAAVLKAVGAVGAQEVTVRLTRRPIEKTVRQRPTPQGTASYTVFSLPVRLSVHVDPELFRAWLYERTGEEKISIARTGETDELEVGLDLAITATEGVLEDLEKSLPEEVTLPRVTIDGNTFTVRLAKPLDERAFRERLRGARWGRLDRVIPLGVKTAAWTMELGRLSEAKRQEKVRDDLLTVFKDNLRQEIISVDFNAVEDQSGVPAEHVRVSMVLGKAVSRDRLYENLTEAGLDPESVLAEPLGEQETASRIDVFLPKAGQSGIEKTIRTVFTEPRPIRRIVSIGASVAGELKGRALLAIILASVIIVLYVAVRFHAFKFGMAAVIALVHDVCVTAGAVAVMDMLGLADVKINLAMLAAFLTIIGYSLNDTIVVFDRIRENMANSNAKDVSAELLDRSINQTLGRTVLTSLTTLLVVTVLFVTGGSVLQGLAFALMVGVVVGTYSSIFVASPVLLDWRPLAKGAGLGARVVLFPITLPMWAVRTLRKGG